MNNKYKHQLKCLSLINVDDSIVNINFDDQNIFLFSKIIIRKLSKLFFKKKKFSFEINYFSDYKESIENIKNASSIQQYNNLINKLKKKKELSYLNEFGPMEKESFIINKNKIYNDFINELKKVNDNFYRILNISNEFELKNGVNNLYVGYGLISGILSNDKKINSYVFNRPAKIIVDNLGIKIEVSNKIIFNKNAILSILDNYISDKNSIKYKENFKKIKQLIKYLKDILLYDVPLVKVIKDLDTILNDNTIIKIVDVYGLVTYDLNEYKLTVEAKKLLSNKIKLLNNPLTHDNEYYKNLEINSKPLIQVNTPLNLFQKFALRSAINENTIIYGPPGTGKSETITNIVANVLVEKKSLLMCCQQQAAIDVVYERLKNLKDFVLYLTSYDDDHLFYEQIQAMATIVGECIFLDESQEVVNFIELDDNERAKDYNNLNYNFLNDINNYIEFCKRKDSNNTDYKTYLAAKENIDNFIGKNLTKIKRLYKNHCDIYYKLQNEIEFLAKVSEYNIFVNKYNLNDLNLNKLFTYQQKLSDFLINNDVANFPKLSYEDIKSKLSILKKFLKDNFLLNDNNFVNQYKKNYGLLLNNFRIMKEIDNKLSFLNKKQKQIIIYNLVKNIHKHESFLYKIKQTLSKTKRNIIIANYLSKSSTSGIYNIFNTNKYKKNDVYYEKKDIFFECVNLINNITLFNNNHYLIDLAKFDESNFDFVMSFFYHNPEAFTEPFIELFNKNIVKFSKPIMVDFYKNQLNKVDYFFSILNTYKYEVLDQYPVAVSLDMDLKVKQYLKDNNDYIIKINLAIHDFLKSNIREKVTKQPKHIKEKMLMMFKLASNEIKYPKIKDFIIEYYNELKVLYNGWLLRPELVSDLVPLKPNEFDIVVFDEASQVVLEKAYPILYRAKKAVITGDSKQLQPNISQFVETTFYNKVNLCNNIELDDAFSLLDRGKTTFWNTYYLRNHYRSVDFRLIDYSNLNFYDNKLIYLSQNKNNVIPFEINDVYDGVNENGINKNEAKLIIEKLQSIVTDEKQIDIFRKILVICFTKKQAVYIYNSIMSDPVKYQHIIRLMRNKKIIINNYESIQGEEGDLSILSFVFDANTKDIGIIQTNKANNFLNVIITRSKKQNVIYKSLTYKQIKDTWDESKLSFVNYVHYLDKLKEEFLSSDNDITFNDDNESSFINEVYDYLKQQFEKKKSNYKLVKNLKIGSFKIDIAIYKSSKQDIKLCLMLNDFKKHLTLDEFLLDLDIYNLFISRGYKPMWILYTQWVSNKDLVINKINEVLSEK